MKKKCFLLNCIYITALCFCIALSSCNGVDEPYTGKASNVSEYYIIGEVRSENKALEGVTVKAANESVLTDVNGTFKLKFSEKGEYKVSYYKEGYVTVYSDAIFSAGEYNRATLFMNQELTKKNASIRVNPDKNTEIKVDNIGVSLFIPAGALKESTDISVTPFIPGKNNMGVSHFLSLNLEPDGLKFEKPLELFFLNPMEGIFFTDNNLRHIVGENGVHYDAGNIVYDSEKNGYRIILSGFSTHSYALKSNLPSSHTATYIGSKGLDNLNGTSPKNETLLLNTKSGWIIQGGTNLSTYLNNQLAGLSLRNDNTLQTIENNIMTAAGITNANYNQSTPTNYTFNNIDPGTFEEIKVYEVTTISFYSIWVYLSTYPWDILITVPVISYEGLAFETIVYDHYHIGGTLY